MVLEDDEYAPLLDDAAKDLFRYFVAAASWSPVVDLPSVIPAIVVLYNRTRGLDLGG